MEERIRDLIDSSVKAHPVVLFMKGTRRAPQCGFSARVVQILDALVDGYETLDVLSDQALREGIKEYSSWPTIPQLYIKGEFIGGCDIVTQLFESGELQDKLGLDTTPPTPPEVTLTERAAQAFRAALQSDDEMIRLEVSPGFDHALSIGPASKMDAIVQTQGLRLAVDRMSAARAEGVSIDYVDTPQGGAFKIDNPNEPPRVKPISPAELKSKLDTDSGLKLIDVRTPQELAIARIAGSMPFDEKTLTELERLEKNATLVFYCHHGVRSQQAAQRFVDEGFTNVFNLSGGIDAWSKQVDPNLPRY